MLPALWRPAGPRVHNRELCALVRSWRIADSIRARPPVDSVANDPIRRCGRESFSLALLQPSPPGSDRRGRSCEQGCRMRMADGLTIAPLSGCLKSVTAIPLSRIISTRSENAYCSTVRTEGRANARVPAARHARLRPTGAQLRTGGQDGMADGLTIAPERRDELERIVVRLLLIAGRCADDPAIQHELMQLSDDLVKIVDEIT